MSQPLLEQIGRFEEDVAADGGLGHGPGWECGRGGFGGAQGIVGGGGSGTPAGLGGVGTDYVEGGGGGVFLAAVDDQWDGGEGHLVVWNIAVRTE